MNGPWPSPLSANANTPFAFCNPTMPGKARGRSPRNAPRSGRGGEPHHDSCQPRPRIRLRCARPAGTWNHQPSEIRWQIGKWETSMRDAVIVDAVRTPLGKRGGALSRMHPAQLSSVVLTALSSRVGFDPAVVDDVIWGCVSQVAEQAANIGRYAVLGAGWPEEIPAVTIDRQCGSSQQ